MQEKSNLGGSPPDVVRNPSLFPAESPPYVPGINDSIAVLVSKKEPHDKKFSIERCASIHD